MIAHPTMRAGCGRRRNQKSSPMTNHIENAPSAGKTRRPWLPVAWIIQASNKATESAIQANRRSLPAPSCCARAPPAPSPGEETGDSSPGHGDDRHQVHCCVEPDGNRMLNQPKSPQNE